MSPSKKQSDQTPHTSTSMAAHSHQTGSPELSSTEVASLPQAEVSTHLSQPVASTSSTFMRAPSIAISTSMASRTYQLGNQEVSLMDYAPSFRPEPFTPISRPIGMNPIPSNDAVVPAEPELSSTGPILPASSGASAQSSEPVPDTSAISDLSNNAVVPAEPATGRGARSRTRVKTYNVKQLAGTAQHTPRKFLGQPSKKSYTKKSQRVAGLSSSSVDLEGNDAVAAKSSPGRAKFKVDKAKKLTMHTSQELLSQFMDTSTGLSQPGEDDSRYPNFEFDDGVLEDAAPSPRKGASIEFMEPLTSASFASASFESDGAAPIPKNPFASRIRVRTFEKSSTEIPQPLANASSVAASTSLETKDIAPKEHSDSHAIHMPTLVESTSELSKPIANTSSASNNLKIIEYVPEEPSTSRGPRVQTSTEPTTELSKPLAHTSTACNHFETIDPVPAQSEPPHGRRSRIVTLKVPSAELSQILAGTFTKSTNFKAEDTAPTKLEPEPATGRGLRARTKVVTYDLKKLSGTDVHTRRKYLPKPSEEAAAIDSAPTLPSVGNSQSNIQATSGEARTNPTQVQVKTDILSPEPMIINSTSDMHTRSQTQEASFQREDSAASTVANTPPPTLNTPPHPKVESFLGSESFIGGDDGESSELSDIGSISDPFTSESEAEPKTPPRPILPLKKSRRYIRVESDSPPSTSPPSPPKSYAPQPEIAPEEYPFTYGPPSPKYARGGDDTVERIWPEPGHNPLPASVAESERGSTIKAGKRKFKSMLEGLKHTSVQSPNKKYRSPYGGGK